jgi:hypothetical protein
METPETRAMDFLSHSKQVVPAISAFCRATLEETGTSRIAFIGSRICPKRPFARVAGGGTAWLSMKGISVKEIPQELRATLDLAAVADSIAMKYRHAVRVEEQNESVHPEAELKGTGPVHAAIMNAVGANPLGAVHEPSRLMRLSKSTVHPHSTQSLGFGVSEFCEDLQNVRNNQSRPREIWSRSLEQRHIWAQTPNARFRPLRWPTKGFNLCRSFLCHFHLEPRGRRSPEAWGRKAEVKLTAESGTAGDAFVPTFDGTAIERGEQNAENTGRNSRSDLGRRSGRILPESDGDWKPCSVSETKFLEQRQRRGYWH